MRKSDCGLNHEGRLTTGSRRRDSADRFHLAVLPLRGKIRWRKEGDTKTRCMFPYYFLWLRQRIAENSRYYSSKSLWFKHLECSAGEDCLTRRRHGWLFRFISVSYRVWCIIKEFYSAVNFSNFSRRPRVGLSINLPSAMAIPAQSRMTPYTPAILVNRGLALALIRALTLLLVLDGLAGTQGGAGT
jgi:hypothetical protein